jgi:hypothetical protein
MISRLIKNPIFRICGIAAILYYGLFQNKYETDSLGNRLAPEKIKANISDMSTKGAYIVGNVRKAEEITKSAQEANSKDEKDTKEVENEQK